MGKQEADRVSTSIRNYCDSMGRRRAGGKQKAGGMCGSISLEGIDHQPGQQICPPGEIWLVNLPTDAPGKGKPIVVVSTDVETLIPAADTVLVCSANYVRNEKYCHAHLPGSGRDRVRAERAYGGGHCRGSAEQVARACANEWRTSTTRSVVDGLETIRSHSQLDFEVSGPCFTLTD